MKKIGIVIAVEKDNVIIRAQRDSSCGSCAGKAACGTLGSWNLKEKNKDDFDIRLPNALNAREGDIVTVEVPDQLILTASMMFYGYPVLAFLIVGGLAFQFAENFGLSGDLFSAIGGLLGAGMTWLWLMKRADSFEMPKMVEIQK